MGKPAPRKPPSSGKGTTAKAAAKPARGRRAATIETSDDDYEAEVESEDEGGVEDEVVADGEDDQQWGYNCIACGKDGELLCCEVRHA